MHDNALILGDIQMFYAVIICYITTHLDPTNYLLNFGILALHEVNPRVIIRFTLKNIRNNRKQMWTQLIASETLDELFENVFEVIETNKVEVW